MPTPDKVPVVVHCDGVNDDTDALQAIIDGKAYPVKSTGEPWEGFASTVGDRTNG